MKRKSIHGIFKVGDTVMSREYFGAKKFRIEKLCGNDYCPIMFCRSVKRNEIYNLFPSSSVLVSSDKRPLHKLKTNVLVKLIRNGNSEAKREFMIRKIK